MNMTLGVFAVALFLSGCALTGLGEQLKEATENHKGFSALCVKIETRFKLAEGIATHMHVTQGAEGMAAAARIKKDCQIVFGESQQGGDEE